MTEDTLDNIAEDIYDMICQIQDDLKESQPRKMALLSTVENLSTICWDLQRLDPETKKGLLHKSCSWPIELVAENLNWIRTDDEHDCPEDVRLIKEELGRMLPKSWPGGKNDALGVILKIVSSSISPTKIDTSEELTKNNAPFRFDNPNGYAFFDLWPSCDPELRIDENSTLILLPKYKRGDRRIQRVWAKAIFKCAFLDFR